jgi:integrase
MMPRHREGPVKNKQTGYYFFDSYIGLGPDRKRVRFSLHTKDPGRAQFLFEQEWKRLWAEYYGLKSPRTQPPIKLGQAIEQFIKYERDVRRAKEWKTIEARLGFAASLWGINRPIRSINHDDFSILDKALKEAGRSLNTVNHYFAILKTFFTWSIDQGYHPGPNPIKSIRPYVVEEKRRAYSPEEIDRILEAAVVLESKAKPNDCILKNANKITMLLLLTGMRAGELFNLKWSSVNSDHIAIPRTETKQRKEKIIPITPAIKEILEKLSLERRDDYILPFRRKSGKMRAGYADNLIHQIRQLTGIKDFVLHGLRHTAATILVSEALGRGVGLADVMQILGHSQVKTTMKYQHFDLSRMRRAVDVLSEKAGDKIRIDKKEPDGYNSRVEDDENHKN